LVRDQLSAAFPGMTWTQTLQPNGAAYGSDFAAIDADRPQNDAVTRTLGNWNTNMSIPDAQWGKALTVVEAVAQHYGFNPPKVLVNRPGAHGVQFDDQYQAVLNFGVGNSAGLTFITGCHLTAAAKRRGHLAPVPTY
jgi:hypothetical protein